MILGLESMAFPGADQIGLVQNLNITRPLWAERFNRPVVFWLTRDSERLIAQYAPDFYRFRSSSIDFPFADISDRRKIKELRRRIEQVSASPETKMRWWWELGLRIGTLALNRAILIACEFGLELPRVGLDQIQKVALSGVVNTVKPLLDLDCLSALHISGGFGSYVPAAHLSNAAAKELSALDGIVDLFLDVNSDETLKFLFPFLGKGTLASIHLSGYDLPSSLGRLRFSEETFLKLGRGFFEAVFSEPSIKSLNLSFCRTTSEGIQELRNSSLTQFGYHGLDTQNWFVSCLPETLRTLFLAGGDALNDEVFAQFDVRSKLRYISLSGDCIFGSGVNRLAKLNDLCTLVLRDTAFADINCAELVELKSLRSLDLQDTSITDECVQFLVLSTGLKELNISRTGLSPAAVANLRTALPRCRIYVKPRRQTGQQLLLPGFGPLL